MKTLDNFLNDERGMSSMVFRLVLAVTIAAAVAVIIVQLLQVNWDTTRNVTQTVNRGVKDAFNDSMKSISD